MKDQSMYLTDEQYLNLLKKIKEVVNGPNFKPYAYDSTEIGNKYTETNCGLCNDDFTTKETAMWPKQFPKRKTMKYRGELHKCPFDTRDKNKTFNNGCFYDCYLFNNKADADEIKKMVNNFKHLI